jgi:hypothetical protein
VLFDQFSDDVSLATVQRAGQHHQHHLHRGDIEQEWELKSSLARRMSPEEWRPTVA